MKKVLAVLGVAVVCAGGCGPRRPGALPEAAPPVPPREDHFRRGHAFFERRELDSAVHHLEAATELDSLYGEALRDLAEIHYLRTLQVPQGASADDARRAMRYYGRLEKLGGDDAEVLERLCELSVMLKDDRSFLAFARRNAELSPDARRIHNLGVAYAGVGDHAGVIRTLKTAAARFPESPYVGGIFRLLGRAYQAADRDQTAERTYTSGLKAVDELKARWKREGSFSATSPEVRRLEEDAVGMLQSLRRIYRIYGEEEKLRSVERRLRDAGRGS
ncbi:MAG: hypothetical protein WB626_02855 [Bacteroidota bacterium]